MTTDPLIQIFGRMDSRDTRRCLRFFKERRMAISFVDIARRNPAPAELRRFSSAHGAAQLLDERSPAYVKAGLGYLAMDDDEIVQRVVAEPALLRLPLVRFGSELTIGLDEEAWRRWHMR